MPGATLTIAGIPPELASRFEQEAARLNLTPAAFLLYLLERANAGPDAERLERHVEEVFGQRGKVMRKLAE